MKKYLLFVFGFVSLLGINTVKADTYQANSFYENFEYGINAYNNYKDNIDVLVNYYKTNLSNKYSYYYINYCYHCGIDSQTSKEISFLSLYPLSDNVVKISSINTNKFILPNIPINSSSGVYTKITYVPELDLYDYDYKYGNIVYLFNSPIYSSTNLIFKSSDNFDKIYYPSYSSDLLNFSTTEYELIDGNVLPTYLTLYQEKYQPLNNTYVEIDLNTYEYIALSLKDYSKEPENNYAEYSNFYVKGQLCATPVYNYGQTERNKVMSGTQVQSCSEYYNEYTLSRFYILQQDLKNHAIYYIKAYDTSKENKIKIDSSYFNISYITSENKDNPEVLIDGKIYPTLPFDSLTDTSNKSTDEGYISGITCAVGDFNCYNEYNPSNVFKDIFDKPLEALKSVWSAIINVFNIIQWFILLLPQTLQSFLYLSFMIAIILGIVKIIL